MRTKRQALQWGLKFLSPYSLLLLFLLIPTLTSAIEGRVVKVKDGDTVVIAPIDGGQFFVCRLYGI
ncbi:MAG: nuclease, partial [Thermodesulfovibrionales bacterium]